MSYGIDYGMGTTNIDRASGIRFGVIPMNELSEWAWDEVESDYGGPNCPDCGADAVDADAPSPNVEYVGALGVVQVRDAGRDDYKHARHECSDYACDACRTVFGSESAFGEEPIGHTLDDGKYKGTVGSDGIDLFVLSSPYFSRARFCSPCAPGACYLTDEADEDGPRAYCLGHEWFQDGKAPYRVFNVIDGSEVFPSEVD